MKKAVFISCFFEKQNPRPLIFYKYLSDVFKTTVVTMDYNHVTKQPVLPPRQQSFAAKKRAFIKQDAVGSEKQPAPDTVYVPVIKYKSNLSPFRMLSHLLFSLHLKKIILREKPDFVYVNFPPNSSAYFAARAAKKCGAALMCDLTDLWPEALPFRGLLKRVVNFTAGHFWRWLRNKALKSADIAVSEADSFIRFTGCDCRTVYLAKDFTPPEIPTVRSAGEGIIKIAYLGSVNHVIDWEALAGIASGLKKRRAEVEIIGGGESLPLLLDRLNEHNICYTYHGLTFDPEQLSRVLVNCDFGFNGYKVETQVALSYKSVDYLSYSLPLLNFTGSDTQKIVEECGCGFNYTPNDLATICAKLDSVTETEMFQMRENAAAAFSNFFSYGHFKEQMDGLLEPYRT